MMKYSIVYAFLILVLCACNTKEEYSGMESAPTNNQNGNDDTQSEVYADIDFTNWKVTLPVDEDGNNKPDEYKPNQLVGYGYQTLAPVIPFMYDSPSDSSLVFYTYPDVSTTNSSYSRTELRELINPDNSRENWSLEGGGIMKGRLSLESISEDTENSSNQYHRTIIMQIHGIISQEDMNTFGFSSNNGPPLIKMYWKDGYIWCHKKSLVDESTSGDALLDVTSNTWTDIKDNMGYIGNDPFDLEIKASIGKIEVILNSGTPLVYEDVSLAKWPFENYFKAGNYLTTTQSDAFSYVKYYNLNVTH